MKTQLTTAMALLALGAFATGCNSKLKECNQVADIVNANVEALHKIGGDLQATHDPTEEGKHAQAMVDAVQEASQKLAAVEIKTDGLKPLVGAYIEMLKQVEAGGRDILAQVEAAGDLSDAKVDATIKALQDAQDGIVKACEKPGPDCAKVAAVLEKFPDDPAEDQLASAFATLGTELEKVELPDGTLKSATTNFIKIIQEKVVLLEKAMKLQKGLETAEKKIDDAVAAEDKVVDDLNGFCGAS